MAFSARIHLLCAPADIAAVRLALEIQFPGWFFFVPVGPIDLATMTIPVPRLWIDSGQWTPAQAAQIQAACAALPVSTVRGVALGLIEEGAVVVDVGDPAPRNEAQARRTIERAVEEWAQDEANQRSR